MSIFKLCIASLIPVIAAIFFDNAEKKTKFSQLSYAAKQVIIGLVFGAIAVIGTEWGIKTNGVVVNARDAAPLISGLMFGGPAGIIAGFIGGMERWFAVYWGVGSLTRVACSVSTCLAGLYAAFIRKYMFDNKRPTWGIALGIGAVMEVLHLTMVMVTNINDAAAAVSVVDACFVPMVVANGISVMLASIVLSVRSEGVELFKRYKQTEIPIFVTIQKWLLIVLALAFSMTMIFDYQLETNMMKKESENAINSTLDEIGNDINDESDKDMINLARMVGREIAYGRYDINGLARQYDVTEICVVDGDGIIIDSNNPDYIGFDMASGEQSLEFMVLLDGKTETYVQKYGPIASSPDIKRKFAGVAIQNGKKFVQISYDASAFQKTLSHGIQYVASNRKIGETGFVIVLDEKLNIVSSSKNINMDDLKQENTLGRDSIEINETVQKYVINGKGYYGATKGVEGYTLVALYPVDEAELARDVSLYVSLFSMLIIFSVMFAVIYILIKKLIVNQITRMTESLANISNGDLDEVVDVRSNREFSSLSDDINSTVDTLKRYIAEAAARIDKELEFAKSIQVSALPEPIALNEHYDIYARMDTAKEVGGDFYDFYLTGDNTVNLLIADVSGKGIPAAMFMMRAKSVLKSFTERGLEVNEVFNEGNNSLCSGNDAGMFVTAWEGILDLTTGKLKFANAGHENPIIKHKDGKFELYKQKVNLVLGGMEDIPYAVNELTLLPGDQIFLYTDGVTEATNSENELFGEQRLVEALNNREFINLKDLCDHIKEEIDGFVKDADQFDDITMVAFEYKG